jgi:hypothetical protein
MPTAPKLREEHLWACYVREDWQEWVLCFCTLAPTRNLSLEFFRSHFDPPKRGRGPRVLRVRVTPEN